MFRTVDALYFVLTSILLLRHIIMPLLSYFYIILAVYEHKERFWYCNADYLSFFFSLSYCQS